LSHNGSNPSHSIVVHLQNWVVWCYDCDDQVLVQAESTIHNCIKLILKAMNLSPPPELELVLVSNSNKLAEDITPQKDNFKNNGQIRGRIKGLTNLGNTCFFNAVIQNLCQTELLYVAAACAAKEGFSQNITPKSKDVPRLTVTIQETAGPVTNALCKLLQDFRGSSGGTLNPRQLFGEICKKATRFKGYRQQDSQELLRYLLDSIRSEEIKRVKRAILKSFGVSGEEDAKCLDDNKRAQVKEYGACAKAPLIDSVFAGRLVSIVTCRQCHKEFKVEEAFLDLSLPLIPPKQESWNFKPFNNGKQNRNSAKAPKSKMDSTSVKDDNSETAAHGNTPRAPSKHQQKAARKAERKKGKKGRGHEKTEKFREFEESPDNNKKNNDMDDEKGEDEKEDEQKRNESNAEDDELGQMKVSDSGGSDEEQEQKLFDKNKVKEALLNADCDECDQVPDNDTVAQESRPASSRGDGVCNVAGLNTLKGEECYIASSERSSVDMSNCETKTEIASSQLHSENVTECSELFELSSPSEEQRCGFKEQSEGRHKELGKKDATEIAKDMENVTLKGGEEVVGSTSQGDTSAPNFNTNFSAVGASETVQEAPFLLDCGGENLSAVEADSSIKREGVNAIRKESLPGGNSEMLNTIVDATDSSANCTALSCSNEENGGVTTQLNNNQTLKATEVKMHQTHSYDASVGNDTKEKDENCENKENCGNEENCESDENCEFDSEEDHERDSGDERTLTLQPYYQPLQGECSVMSCFSYFCATECLDGNNKFACEECSRRAQRCEKSRRSSATGDTRKKDDREDADEDEEGYAEASKKKEPVQTVYTVATKQLLISFAPPVLTLHLKRFQQARFTLRKLTTHVDFPLELNLAPFCIRNGMNRADSEGRVLYSLYGIVQHSGNMNSGHYTAYVKVNKPPIKALYDRITNMNELTDFIKNMWTETTEQKKRNPKFRYESALDGQWFHVSDSSVSSVPETKVLKSQAYMLFYGRLPFCES